MNPARLAGAAALLLGAGAAACGAQATDARVVSSDPALVELASQLLPDLVARSGLDLHEPVRLERRSREQLRTYLLAQMEEQLPADEREATVQTYAMLGLVPADLDLESVLLGLYGEQVAGFYEPDSTALFVMDDQSEEALEGLLVHELVHAIQDQNTDLGALTDADLDNDRATAAQAAIEGHATLVMLEYLTEQMAGMRIDLSQIPDFATQMRPLLEAMRAQFPELASAPRIISESMIFPYLEGTSYVQSLWTGGERHAPFGDRMPQSTEQVLTRGAAAPPVELEIDVAGSRVVRNDVLGRLEVGIFLEEHGVTDTSVADGWEGDRYVLVETANGGRALGWFAVWEDGAARSRFMTAMQSVVPRLGAETTLDAVDVGGRPATLLQVGRLSGITARIRTGA